MNDTTGHGAPPSVRHVSRGCAAPKTFVDGTHRTCAPSETLARVQPWLKEMGITRVANVTGLDRTGVHVVAVYRPNARSISVAQGKGLTLEAAKASGVMEAVEVWHAERILNPLKLASCAEMRRTHTLADVHRLPRPRDSRYSDELPMLWIEGIDLLSDRPVWVPYELVSANYSLDGMPAAGCFQTNTKGLASGNHWLEAVSHAVSELVESDSRTLWRMAGAKRRRLLALDSVDDAACCSILARLTHAGLRVRVWDVTSDIGIPAFLCAIAGDGEDEADPEFGAGCHPSRNIALLRALTEAGQARNTYISAARDDYFPHLYSQEQRAFRRTMFQCWLAVEDASRRYAEVPDFTSESVDDDVNWMLTRLRASGIEQVVAVDLTRSELGIPVARLVIPGLEGVMEHSDQDYLPGERLRRLMEVA